MIYNGKILCALEKNVYSAAVEQSVLHISVGSIWSIVLFEFSVSLLIFCFDVLSIKRQGRMLYNDKRINMPERYNNFKYIYAPNIRMPKHIKQN